MLDQRIGCSTCVVTIGGICTSLVNLAACHKRISFLGWDILARSWIHERVCVRDFTRWRRKGRQSITRRNWIRELKKVRWRTVVLEAARLMRKQEKQKHWNVWSSAQFAWYDTRYSRVHAPCTTLICVFLVLRASSPTSTPWEFTTKPSTPRLSGKMSRQAMIKWRQAKHKLNIHWSSLCNIVAV